MKKTKIIMLFCMVVILVVATVIPCFAEVGDYSQEQMLSILKKRYSETIYSGFYTAITDSGKDISTIKSVDRYVIQYQDEGAQLSTVWESISTVYGYYGTQQFLNTDVTTAEAYSNIRLMVEDVEYDYTYLGWVRVTIGAGATSGNTAQYRRLRLTFGEKNSATQRLIFEYRSTSTSDPILKLYSVYYFNGTSYETVLADNTYNVTADVFVVYPNTSSNLDVFTDGVLCYQRMNVYDTLEAVDKAGGADEGQLESEYNRGFEDGKAEGYFLGYADGEVEGIANYDISFNNMVTAIFRAPGEFIDGIFGFEIFGIDISGFMKTLLTVAVMGAIVFFVWKVVR